VPEEFWVAVAGGFLDVADGDASVEDGGDESVPQGVGEALAVTARSLAQPAALSRRETAHAQ
jgi:hypothetical protein